MSQKHDQMKEVRQLRDPADRRGDDWRQYWYDTKTNKIWEIQSGRSSIKDMHHSTVIEHDPDFFRLSLDDITLTGRTWSDHNLDLARQAGWVRVAISYVKWNDVIQVVANGYRIAHCHKFTKTAAFKKYIEGHQDENISLLVDPMGSTPIVITGKSAIRMFIKTGRQPSMLQRFREFMEEDAPVSNTGHVANSNLHALGQPHGKFAGCSVFRVKPELFDRCKNRKSKKQRWSQILNLEDETEVGIYNYAKKFPKQPIAVQNERDHSLYFLRKYR